VSAVSFLCTNLICVMVGFATGLNGGEAFVFGGVCCFCLNRGGGGGGGGWGGGVGEGEGGVALRSGVAVVEDRGAHQGEGGRLK
jgi:hypothetical protein